MTSEAAHTPLGVKLGFLVGASGFILTFVGLVLLLSGPRHTTGFSLTSVQQLGFILLFASPALIGIGFVAAFTIDKRRARGGVGASPVTGASVLAPVAERGLIQENDYYAVFALTNDPARAAADRRRRTRSLILRPTFAFVCFVLLIYVLVVVTAPIRPAPGVSVGQAQTLVTLGAVFLTAVLIFLFYAAFIMLRPLPVGLTVWENGVVLDYPGGFRWEIGLDKEGECRLWGFKDLGAVGSDRTSGELRLDVPHHPSAILSHDTADRVASAARARGLIVEDLLNRETGGRSLVLRGRGPASHPP